MPSWSDSCQIGSLRDPYLSSVAAGDQQAHLMVLKMAQVACSGRQLHVILDHY